MKNIKVEQTIKSWERQQQFLLRKPKTETIDKIPNRKRSERFGYTYENKQYNKYGLLPQEYIENYYTR